MKLLELSQLGIPTLATNEIDWKISGPKKGSGREKSEGWGTGWRQRKRGLVWGRIYLASDSIARGGWSQPE